MEIPRELLQKNDDIDFKKAFNGGSKRTGGSKKSKTKKRLKLKGLKKKSLQKKGTKKGSKKGSKKGAGNSESLPESPDLPKLPESVEMYPTKYKAKQEMLGIVDDILDNLDYEQSDARIKMREQEMNLNEIDEWLRNFVEAASKVNKIKMLQEEIEATKNDPHSDIYKSQYLEKLYSLREELEKLGSLEDAKKKLAEIN